MYPGNNNPGSGGVLQPFLLVRVKSGGEDFKKLIDKQVNFFYFGNAKVGLG